MNELTRLATEAARSAGAVIMDGFEKPHDTSMKGRRELVTESDRASEEIIIRAISAECPNDLIIAEETAPELAESSRVWIVDPLDGTNNYAHGYPFFSVAIALEEEGELVAGVVYDPLRDEMFVAEREQGASVNGRPVRVSANALLLESLVATGFPYDRTDDSGNNLDNLNRLIVAVRGIRRGGSAELDLVYVARGRLDGFWEQGLKTWDVSAGGLIVLEAGGVVTNIGGDAWNHRRGDVIASNGLIHGQMLQLIG
ncbi:MAG: inositol monophosphatase [Candidatus Eisenbacteria sp.]|nr:inositol monophosphatase [Candidatus Eisenbacteria bacterium]